MSYKDFRYNLITKKYDSVDINEPYILPNAYIEKYRNLPNYTPLNHNHDNNLANPFILYTPGDFEPIAMEYYDTIPNIVEGRRSKGFILANGAIFKPLFDELRNNTECSYITYNNELIKSGYTPRNISTLMYEATDDTRSELVNCRLLNYFGVPTVYMQNMVNVNDFNFLLSVDFIGKNEKFIPYATITKDEFEYNTPLRKIMDILYEGINVFYMNEGEYNRENILENYNNIAENFAYQFIVEKYVLGLCDIFEGNMGILHNTIDNTISIAPLFDLEYYDNHVYNNMEHLDELEDDIEFLQKHYPNAFNKLENICNTILYDNGMNDINNIYEGYFDDLDDFKCNYAVVIDNISLLEHTMTYINEEEKC
ncbi:MAG: hypothetical protein E7361_00005 [Clostridiales bacterium]|nr:hypothetical protein [Clostridiales bacterium]